RHPEGCLVPFATRGGWCPGEVLREGHGQACAGDERFEERRAERASRPGGSDGCDLFLELRNPADARCVLGAALAADACGHFDQVEPVACLRCARTKSGTSVAAVRE